MGAYAESILQQRLVVNKFWVPKNIKGQIFGIVYDLCI